MTLRRRDVLLGALGTGLALALPASAARRANFCFMDGTCYDCTDHNCRCWTCYYRDRAVWLNGEDFWLASPPTVQDNVVRLVIRLEQDYEGVKWEKIAPTLVSGSQQRVIDVDNVVLKRHGIQGVVFHKRGLPRLEKEGKPALLVDLEGVGNTRIWQADWFSHLVVYDYLIEDKNQPIGERIWYHANTQQDLSAWHLQSSPAYWMKTPAAWAGTMCFDPEGDKEMPAYESYVPDWATVADGDLQRVRDGLPLRPRDIVQLASAKIYYTADDQLEPYRYGPKQINPLLVSRDGRVVTG